jgi:hypothetical protein
MLCLAWLCDHFHHMILLLLLAAAVHAQSPVFRAVSQDSRALFLFEDPAVGDAIVGGISINELSDTCGSQADFILTSKEAIASFRALARAELAEKEVWCWSAPGAHV